MLRRQTEARQRWGGINSALDRWLEQRQKVLVSYCKLAGLAPYSKDREQLPAINDIHTFCETLVDYISAGHFELYADLLNTDLLANNVRPQTTTQAESIIKVAEQIYPFIASTTEEALTFNDRYSGINENDNLLTLDSDLSIVGEAIETRLEYEDKLLLLLSARELLQNRPLD